MKFLTPADCPPAGWTQADVDAEKDKLRNAIYRFTLEAARDGADPAHILAAMASTVCHAYEDAGETITVTLEVRRPS
jgi:hypothetical protein